MNNKIPPNYQEAFRVAVRREGATINAYMAPMHTMEGAKPIASISAGLCQLDRTIFEDFKALVAKSVESLAKASFGDTAVLGTEFREAPAHERAGHA